MNYVVSDVHGRLDRLKKLVEVISLKDEDRLYILGDMVDRGSDPIGVIKYVMSKENIISIMGNHDRMMLNALKYKDEVELERWNRNGNDVTLNGFNKLSRDEQEKILEYLDSLDYHKIIEDRYFLVHAGIDKFLLEEDMKFMSFEEALSAQERELVWIRENFFKNKSLDGYIVIFGHTPRPSLDKRLGKESEKPYKIWFDQINEDKICIDTSNCYEGGRMACLRLDDMKEFYVE